MCAVLAVRSTLLLLLLLLFLLQWSVWLAPFEVRWDRTAHHSSEQPQQQQQQHR